MFALLFGLMYVMFIRPQAKRRKDAENMQKQLGAGDKIITIGGLHGSVVAVDDDTVTVEIAPGVNARFARAAVARVVEQTTVPAEHVVDSATDGDAKP
jgi:preprotein translocase subunit YajC